MDAVNYRAGNYVYDNQIGSKGEFKLTTGDLLDIVSDRHEYTPLKLTLDRLKKLGATNKGNYYFIGKMRFSFSSLGVVRFHWEKKVSYLEYVHNLQNLHKELIGEELDFI